VTNIIRIKPHHFVDIITSFSAQDLTFEPSLYGHAVHTVSEHIPHDRDVILEMELGADDICAPCKHNINGLCDDIIDTSFRPEASSSKREWNLMIDKRWCERLNLQQGDRLTAKEFCEQLQSNTDDITDIYREIPNDQTAERLRDLKAGIKRLLGC
jgi:hypothetical protein